MTEATPTGAESPSEFTAGSSELTDALSSLLDSNEQEETPDTADDSEDALDPDDAPAVETEDDTAESEDEPLYEVKIDGEVRHLSLDELRAAAQKSVAASKRFEEAAQTRKAAEAEIAQVQQERQLLSEALNQYVGQLQAMQQQQTPNWDQLLKSDPQGYLEQKHAYEQRQAQLQQAQTAQAYLSQQQEADQARLHQEYLQTQSQKLLDAIPEWRDAEVAKQGRKEVREYLQGIGMDDGMISNISDARAVVMARKAMLYDRLASKQAPTLKKASKAPPRVERPGVPAGNADERTQALKQLGRSGKLDDAAAAFSAYFR